MYKAGDFLYKLGDKGIKKESQRVFIYTGINTIITLKTLV